MKKAGKSRKWLMWFAVSALSLYLLFLLLAFLYLPFLLEKSEHFSTVVFDRNDQLIGAHIADDGQWRFPAADSVPLKYAIALTQFEDKYFYWHPGINFISIIKAFVANARAGKVIRGGSTINMQAIRLLREGRKRSVPEKVREIFLAIALETRFSKNDILNIYASNAPFGGNTVGLDAACWRYFGHDSGHLTWSEAALLAVLPNAPSLIHPGKNREKLLFKRDKLLDQLHEQGKIDSIECVLAKLETLPDKPMPLPQLAPHLVDYYWIHNRGQRIQTTLDASVQQHVNEIVEIHQQTLSKNQIFNAAVLVADPGTKQVIAYVGNTHALAGEIHQNNVDMIRAKRSTGSILKPLLFAAMIEEGMILPHSLVPDIPSYFSNYHPKNFNDHFEGAVQASRALSKSLNVPAVYMLKNYGTGRFLHLLQRVGISSFNKSADHYGLTMILGGGEASLLEITNMYAGMAKVLLDYDQFYGEYQPDAFSPLKFDSVSFTSTDTRNIDIPLHAGSVWTTYQALYEVQRPESESGWENFSSSQTIAWKTGTSFGFRDAWAVGSTPAYVVGVWVGNADGEGRDGLIGNKVAAPLMFDVFNFLKTNSHFKPPFDELDPVVVCRESGFRATPNCPEKDTILTYIKGINAPLCTFHKLIFTDASGNFRLSANCASVSELQPKYCFVLPPVQERYYRKEHPAYAGLPPFRKGCELNEEASNIEFIYPVNNTRVYISRGAGGEPQNVIFEVSCRSSSGNTYWHLDNRFIGTTSGNHQLAVIPEPGRHKLVVVDENGESAGIQFDVVNEK